jgi:hypothetical protein
LVDDHPVVIDVDLKVSRFVRPECGERPDVCGSFDRDQVTRIEEDLADQVERLLRAARDDHVLGVARYAFGRHQHGEPGAKRKVSLPAPVLQRRRAVLVEHGSHDLEHVFCRKRLHERHATGERDNLGPRGHREQCPHL